MRLPFGTLHSGTPGLGTSLTSRRTHNVDHNDRANCCAKKHHTDVSACKKNTQLTMKPNSPRRPTIFMVHDGSIGPPDTAMT